MDRASAKTVLERAPDAEFRCIFCGGRLKAYLRPPVLFHSTPPCKPFHTLTEQELIQAHRAGIRLGTRRAGRALGHA